MDQIEKYIEELMEKSTPDRPIWNIEKIMQGLKSTWNYIDGCMIKAMFQMGRSGVLFSISSSIYFSI